MWRLILTRPLAFFDIESTGTNPRMDRLIDLAIIKIMPGGTRGEHVFRVHPEGPIPPETTAVHGITDADVAGLPTFKERAGEIAAVLEECDLAGYNAIRFDIPMLVAEFRRAEVEFSLEGRRQIDPQRIFHQREPRDLSAALRFYSGELHLGAHGALDDVLATVRVLEGQYETYGDLPATIDELHEVCNPQRSDWVDKEGRLRWTHGEAAINFGKNQGKSLRRLVESDTGFLNWILQNDFPDDTKEFIRNAIKGVFPAAPGKGGGSRMEDRG